MRFPSSVRPKLYENAVPQLRFRKRGDCWSATAGRLTCRSAELIGDDGECDERDEARNNAPVQVDGDQPLYQRGDMLMIAIVHLLLDWNGKPCRDGSAEQSDGEHKNDERARDGRMTQPDHADAHGQAEQSERNDVGIRADNDCVMEALNCAGPTNAHDG